MSDRDNVDPFATPAQQVPPPAGPTPLPPPSHAPSYDPSYGQPDAAAYGYGNAYGTPYASSYAVPTAAATGEKNFLGVLALVFPFVGLSLVGIVVGHMGLAAAKKGIATNRAVALAGTVISWVVTSLTVLGVLASIAIPIFLTQREADREADAKADLNALHTAIASHFSNSSEPPAVDIDGERYIVGDGYEPKSDSVVDVDFVMSSVDDYCIAVTYGKGKVLSSTAPGQFAQGACPAPDPQSSAGTDDDADDASSPDLAGFDTLMVGDCIADPYDNVQQDESGSSWLPGVTVVDCTQMHYGEVYGVLDIVADEYVEDNIYAAADELCFGAYEEFMGVAYADSTMFYEPYYPTPDGWKFGDTQVTCVVTSMESDTVGTLAGSGR